MKKFLLVAMFMLLPFTVQAEGMTWHETNDPYLDMNSLHVVAGSYEFADGTECKVLLFKQSWGSFYEAGAPACGSTGGGASEALLQAILDELQSQKNPWDNGLNK